MANGYVFQSLSFPVHKVVIISASTSSMQIIHVELLREYWTQSEDAMPVGFSVAAVTVRFRNTAWYISEQDNKAGGRPACSRSARDWHQVTSFLFLDYFIGTEFTQPGLSLKNDEIMNVLYNIILK